MGTVVVVNAVLACSHQGQIQVTAGDSRLTVGGAPVLISGKESELSFASAQPPCQNKTTSSPPSPAPCVTQPATPAGLAGKLTVGGQPVLLDSAGGSTLPAVTPAAPGTWSVHGPGQSKLAAS